MLNYIVRRLLLMFPTLIGITLLVFLTMALSPGGVAAQLDAAEMGMRAEDREALRQYYNERYGLDQPLLVQYAKWLHRVSPIGIKEVEPAEAADPEAAPGQTFGFKVPDLGESFTRAQPVTDMVRDALPVTLLLNLLTIPIIYTIAIISGIYAGRHRGKTFDVASGVTFLALWSMPVIWVGVLLIGFLANRDFIQLFPTGGLHHTLADQWQFLPRWTEAGFERGWLLDLAWHLVLPVLCLTYGGFAFLSKLMRASVLENINADYARTARAKGVPDRAVLFRHVLRNSLLPLITVAAAILPGLLGGSLIVETIFSINGMGRLMIEAIFARDREVVLATTLVIGAISLLSLLVADICYAIADPRVSYE
jgi:microcin C transport system permease protein